MAAHRHDRAAFLTAARESQVIFEAVMRADPLGKSADDGWTPPDSDPARRGE